MNIFTSDNKYIFSMFKGCMVNLEISVSGFFNKDAFNTVCPVCNKNIKGSDYIIKKYGTRVHKNLYCSRVSNED